MAEHQAYIKQFVDDNGVFSWKKYAIEMNNRAFGGIPELAALALAYEAEVHVYKASPMGYSFVRRYKSGLHGRVYLIRLLKHGAHYDVLRPTHLTHMVVSTSNTPNNMRRYITRNNNNNALGNKSNGLNNLNGLQEPNVDEGPRQRNNSLGMTSASGTSNRVQARAIRVTNTVFRATRPSGSTLHNSGNSFHYSPTAPSPSSNYSPTAPSPSSNSGLSRPSGSVLNSGRSPY